MGEQLYISHSSMNAFRKCPRFYYWKYIRRLEKRTFKLPFIVGRIMHHGIQMLLRKPEDAEKEISAKFKEEAKKARKEFLLSPIQEDDLAAQEYAVIGMLNAFRNHYSQFLKKTEHVMTEKSLRYELNKKVVIVGKIDSILLNQDLRWMWELKNLKSLDMDRIKGIKTDPQSALYRTVHNLTVKKSERLDGILYQIIRKPQIRQKNKESRREFLERLQDWYSSSEGGMKFHLERTKGSFIQGDAVINMVTKVSEQILACKKQEDYFQDSSRCVSEWDYCAYYGVCHGEDKKKEEKLLTIRKKYRIEDDETANVVE